MLPTWRDQIKTAKRAVHDAFAIPVTVHFSGHDCATTARHNRAGAVVGQAEYAQALIEADQLVFMLEDLDGYTLERGLKVTLGDRTATLGDVYPPDLNKQTVDISWDKDTD